MVPFARNGPSSAAAQKEKEKPICPACGRGFHQARNNYVVCQLCSSQYHKKKCAGKLPGLNAANNYVCRTCNPEDEPSLSSRGRGRAAPAPVPDCAPPGVGPASGDGEDPSHPGPAPLATVVVPASGLEIDVSDMVISGELAINHEQEQGLPTCLENLPKMDRLLTDVGFERSSTQKMTLGDGNCGPRGNYYHSD